MGGETLTLIGLGGLVLIAAGMAFFKWGGSSVERKHAKEIADVQEAIAQELAKPAPRGDDLRDWMRRNSDDEGS